jgi:hypothetical protein
MREKRQGKDQHMQLHYIEEFCPVKYRKLKLLVLWDNRTKNIFVFPFRDTFPVV